MMVEDLQTLLRIPTIQSSPQPDAPFGPENRVALDWALAKSAEWGMKTRDLEGYCGWAEFGSGDRMIAIMGHLDVVPVGPGWKYDPFSATIDGDYLYSRGAIDDKGPTVAAFFAAKALMETLPDLGIRIRMIFGCNEESGFKCIERYMETEEVPWLGFAPDAGWPLYHAEKGIANLRLTVTPETTGMTPVSLVGGQRTNIVIDHAVGVVKVAATVRAEVEDKLAKTWDKNLSYSWNGDELHVTAAGKAAHGSWPHGGDNAATRILRFWMEIAPTVDKLWYEVLFETAHISGDGLGINGRDEYSELTSNLGICTTDGKFEMTFNIRYPVTWKAQQLIDRATAALDRSMPESSIVLVDDSEPLFFPLDHPLVKTVVDVYTEETGEARQPGVMGGGTYARAVPNCVAIGTGWAGDGEAHQTDERVKVAHIAKMARIYAHILYRLSQLPAN